MKEHEMRQLGDTYRTDGFEVLEPRVLFNGDAILALGDSITASNASHLSYRYYLWTQLVDAGVAFDYVGSENTNNGHTPNWPDYQGQSFDRDNEGHSGFRVDQINDALPGYLSGYTPDLVIIHLGTNDLNQGQSASSTIDDLRETITLLRADNPDVTVFLSQIIPTQRAWNGEADQLNAAIPGLANELSTARSQIIVVDQNSGFSINDDLRDQVHPNTQGEQKMAQRYYDAIADFYNASVPNTAPSANAGPNQTQTDTDGNGSQNFTLDGRSSSDSDGSIASYVWRRGGSTIATGQQPTVSLGVGTHTIELTVTDDDGGIATATSTAVVQGVGVVDGSVRLSRTARRSHDRPAPAPTRTWR